MSFAKNTLFSNHIVDLTETALFKVTKKISTPEEAQKKKGNVFIEQ